MTLRGGPCASRDGVTSVVADFDAVDEMNADGPARKGKKADAGLARRAIAAANLVFESMMEVSNGRRALERR